MEMTKEELQRRISELTADLARGASETEHLKKTLGDAQRRMSVIDRPKVTQKFLNELSDAIENAVGNIDFDDTHAYEFDFSLDYNNTVQLDSIEFNHAHDIGDEIYSKLEDLFNVIEDEDEA